jgi:hypothetical protein
MKLEHLLFYIGCGFGIGAGMNFGEVFASHTHLSGSSRSGALIFFTCLGIFIGIAITSILYAGIMKLFKRK